MDRLHTLPVPGYPAVVARTERIIEATPQQVFAVLADGWTYSDWVVGTAHIRDVDAAWPAPGSQLHHKAGPWPLSLKDTSTVVAVTPDRELHLRAGLWPLGEAEVHIRLEPVGTASTRVVIEEDFRAGPLLGLRNKINDLVLHGRNTEALARLADLAEAKRTTLTNS
ncbi:SRPBCC family protein [Actinoplanes sp. LDG1-06]|uniref:SRPBCC family protein n=1 Tax=Paractinoplanes ovalisporus TaxID=2810368 RepID=A0ABS2A7B5_9ACTN|nr:SRPBCC family protein [Actinoplanes ovalisporus]MBM2615677.1 SRPBCC family protein [Actinoplanes ovalisporus]